MIVLHLERNTKRSIINGEHLKSIKITRQLRLIKNTILKRQKGVIVVFANFFFSFVRP